MATTGVPGNTCPEDALSHPPEHQPATLAQQRLIADPPAAPTRAGAVEPIALNISAVLVEQIAVRVADLLRTQTQPQSELASPWLDLDDACAYLRLSRDALYKLTAAHAIPCRKKAGGQGLRFHRDELDGWMEAQYPRLDRLG
jgi:excisionase family DNA binding protein